MYKQNIQVNTEEILFGGAEGSSKAEFRFYNKSLW